LGQWTGLLVWHVCCRVLRFSQIFTRIFTKKRSGVLYTLSTQHIPIGFHPAHTMDESLCARIERAKKRAVHRHRLATMTSSVDSSCPRSQLRGRRKNPKKAQLDEDRFALIERENRLMLISMSKIMLRQPIKKHPSHVRSLNLQQRQRDMKRINYDNQLLLSRIEKTTPYCK
jgi:hypothetical protein